MITLKPLDIEDAHAHIVQDALKKHLPDGVRVYAFGSRAAWQAKKASDLDLALDAKEGLKSNIADLEEELSQSDLPYKVDIVNLNNIAKSFKNAIKPDLVPILWDWEEKKLGDVITLHYGKSLPSSKRIEGNIPVYSSAGLTGWHNKALVESEALIIGRKGTIGKIYKTGVPFFAIDTSYYILPDADKYNFDYLFYLLSDIGLDELNEDSAVPGLNRETAYSQKILLPPLKEQEAIGEVLSSLDDKIDLIHRQNKTLEALAETLFHHHFIENADDSWGEKRLGDFFDVRTGKKNSNYAINDGEYPFFTCSQKSLLAPDYSFDGDAILLAGNGDFNIKRYSGKFEAYQRTYVLIPYNPKYFNFLYILMKFYLSDITGGYQGSVINFITKGMIEDFTFKFPTDNENLLVFDELNLFFTKVDSNTKQIQTLEKLRDALLPKLISGKIRVGYKEEVVL